jgi:O-antigen/teichoic acid export membrane protein
VALGISLIIKEVVALISAPAFHDAYKIVPIVLLAYVFQGTYRYVASGMYIAHKTMYVGFISAIALAANLGLNYVLIPHYKGIGAASATALSFVLMAALAYAAAQKIRPVPYRISDLVVPVTIAALIYWTSTMVSVSPLVLSAALKASFFLLFPLLLYLIGYMERDETEKVKEMASLLLHRFGWGAATAPER